MGRTKNLSTSCSDTKTYTSNITYNIQWNVTNRRNNRLFPFHWFLIEIHNILQWTVGSTVCYRESENWMMETAYSKVKVGNLL